MIHFRQLVDVSIVGARAVPAPNPVFGRGNVAGNGLFWAIAGGGRAGAGGGGGGPCSITKDRKILFGTSSDSMVYGNRLFTTHTSNVQS